LLEEGIENIGIINFNSIAEDGDAQWSSTLGVIGMDQRTDDGLPES